MRRRPTKPVYVGNVKVGGDAPVTVQSMTKTDTRDVKATVRQIKGSGGRRRGISLKEQKHGTPNQNRRGKDY